MIPAYPNGSRVLFKPSGSDIWYRAGDGCWSQTGQGFWYRVPTLPHRENFWKLNGQISLAKSCPRRCHLNTFWPFEGWGTWSPSLRDLFIWRIDLWARESLYQFRPNGQKFKGIHASRPNGSRFGWFPQRCGFQDVREGICAPTFKPNGSEIWDFRQIHTKRVRVLSRQAS